VRRLDLDRAGHAEAPRYTCGAQNRASKHARVKTASEVIRSVRAMGLFVWCVVQQSPEQQRPQREQPATSAHEGVKFVRLRSVEVLHQRSHLQNRNTLRET
jgi:hypothetical protein